MHEHPVQIPELSYGEPKFKHRLEYTAFRSFSFLLSLLPLKLSFIFVHLLADFARVILKKKSRETFQSIQEKLKCEDREAHAILKKSYHTFAENWALLCQSYNDKNNVPEFSPEIKQLFEKAKKENRGIIFATGHLSWWEQVPKILHHQSHAIAITVAVQHNPLFDKYVNQQRTCGGFHSILHNRLGIRHTFNYLKKGGHLVILADVDVREKGIPVPFMKQLASTPKWPAELSIRTNSLLCTTRHKIEHDGTQSIQVGPVIDPNDFTNKDTAIYEISKQMNDSLSKFVYDTPEQWFWLQRRWKTHFPEND